MALGGEIASMYVRLRPHLGNFAAEASSGIRGALTETELKVNASARANVAADVRNVEANRALARSYRQIGSAAARGSEEARVATRLAAESTSRANALVGHSARHAAHEHSRLRHTLLHAGAVVGVGFGAEIAVEKIKELVGAAASVQKSVEVIKNSFGKSASEVIVKFGDTVAARLGISADLADATSARFGILFKNLGLGQQQAAGMTVGLEKLAGSLSAIRGVAPERAFQQITLAMLGNVRSLKQLGLAVDVPTEKLAALKLGLISNIHQALTPATRAQAIYALATAHLPQFLEQARKHSNDLANVQRRLAAEWENTKDILGTALLPIFRRYAIALSDWLDKMNKSGRLQHDFNVIARTTADVTETVVHAVGTGWRVFETAAGWVGGTKRAVELLLGALAVSKLAGLGRGFTGIVGSIKNIGTVSRAAAVTFGISSAAIDAEAVATSAVIKSALISTGIGALVVAAGIAAAYVITHFEKVKRWIAGLGHWIAAHAHVLFFVPFVGEWLFAIGEVIRHFNQIRATVRVLAHFFATVFVHPIRAIQQLFRHMQNAVVEVFRGIVSTVGGLLAKIPSWLPGLGKFHGWGKDLQAWAATLGASAGQTLGEHFAKTAGGFLGGVEAITTGVFGKVGAAIHAAGKKLTQAGGGDQTKRHKDLVDHLNQLEKAGKSAVDTTGSTVADAVKTAAQKVRDSVSAAKSNLDAIGQKLAEAANKVIDKMGGPVGVSRSQEAAFKKLRDLIAGGGGSNEVLRASQQLASQMQAAASAQVATDTSARHDRVKRQFADLTNEFNRGQITMTTFNKRVAALLHREHVTYKTAGKFLGKSFADGFHEKLGALHKQAGAIAALPRSLRRTGGGGDETKIIQPLQVLHQQNEHIASLAAKQRERQIKAAEKTSKEIAKTRALLEQEGSLKLGMLPGHTAKKAKKIARTGVKP